MASVERLIVNGQQAFGESVLEALLERGETIVGVYCEPDVEGRRLDPIKEVALANGVPVYQPKSFKAPEVWEELKTLEADLCVMAYVTRIVPQAFLDIPRHGTIQYHPSLLPLHRGPSSINWPIIQGETKTGLSIFWPDEGIDTGPILLQKEFGIGDDDTLGSLYFDKLFPMGVEAILESVDLVRAGKAPKIAQDDSLATYEGWCTAEDVRIDWSRPAADVYNLIRGANPQPGAWTTHEGNKLRIFDCAKAPASDGAPGEVTAVDGEGVSVAAAGGDILIKRLRPESGAKQAAAEYAAAGALTKSSRLG